MFFNANFPAGYMNATVSGPHISVDELDERLTLTASADIPTTLMRVLGFDTLTVSATTEITRQMQALDVVIAIDMSGSMGSSSGATTRIAAARDAGWQPRRAGRHDPPAGPLALLSPMKRAQAQS